MTISNRIFQAARVTWIAIMCAFSGVGCDSTVTPSSGTFNPPPAEEHLLSTTSKATVHNSSHVVQIDSLGMIRKGSWSPASASIEAIDYTRGSGAGVWLYAELDKPRANVTFFGYSSSYTITEVEEEPIGIFVLTEDSLHTEIDNWPVELGAPSTIEGQPKLYGDMMAWGLFTVSDPTPNDFWDALNDPIIGLDIGQTIYMYETIAGQNILFVRFDLINNTTETISDLHVGFHTDTDLTIVFFDSNHCTSRADAGTNRMGYDEALALSYTYSLPDPADVNNPADCHGAASGFMFIDTPLSGDASDQVLAHTIIKKNIDFDYPGFGELDYTETRHFGMALKGLSTMGTPMIDPTTGLETKYAFTGDPIAGTGWLDSPKDNRSLLSLKPFTIMPGETKSITVAWIIVAEANLEAGLSELKSLAASIRNSANAFTD